MLHWLHFIQWTGFVIYGLLQTSENLIRVSNGGSVSISIRILHLFFNSKQNCRCPCCPIFLNFSCRDMWSWTWAHSRECELKSWMLLLGQSWRSVVPSLFSFVTFLADLGGAIISKLGQLQKTHDKCQTFMSLDPWKTLWSQPLTSWGTTFRWFSETEVHSFFLRH